MLLLLLHIRLYILHTQLELRERAARVNEISGANHTHVELTIQHESISNDEQVTMKYRMSFIVSVDGFRSVSVAISKVQQHRLAKHIHAELHAHACGL